MTERPHYHGHRERLRAKLLQDSRQLADYEILELILGMALVRQDTKPLAKELLARFKTFRGVFLAKPEELRALDGFGPSLDVFWRLLREFRARFDEAPLTERQILSSPALVADLAKTRIGFLSAEEFWVAMVDNKNRLMAWERVSKGTVDQAAVYPREVLSLALERKASGIILVHNHPGGDPAPSRADIDFDAADHPRGQGFGHSGA